MGAEKKNIIILGVDGRRNWWNVFFLLSGPGTREFTILVRGRANRAKAWMRRRSFDFHTRASAPREEMRDENKNICVKIGELWRSNCLLD